MVFGGLNKTAHVDEIAQELAKVRGRIALTLRAERHREAFVRVFGDQGLTALQRRPLIEELLVGVDPTPMLVQLDALLACGMAEIETIAGDQRELTDQSDPIALARLPVTSAVTDDPPLLAQNLYDQLFGDDTGPVRLPDLDAAASPFDDDDKATSGVMQMPSTAAQAHAAAAASRRRPTPPSSSCARRCCTEYLAIQGKDYYQVLGVARDGGGGGDRGGLRAPSASSSASSASPSVDLGPRLRAPRGDPCHGCAQRSRRCRRASCARAYDGELDAQAAAVAGGARRRPAGRRRRPSGSLPAMTTAPAICSSAPSPRRPTRPTTTRCSPGPCSSTKAPTVSPARARFVPAAARGRARPARSCGATSTRRSPSTPTTSAPTSSPAASPPPPATTRVRSII